MNAGEVVNFAKNVEVLRKAGSHSDGRGMRRKHGLIGIVQLSVTGVSRHQVEVYLAVDSRWRGSDVYADPCW